MYVNNETNDSVWPSKLLSLIVVVVIIVVIIVVIVVIIPYDGSPLTDIRSIIIPLSVYLYFIATVGIVFAIGCSIVNFCLRKKKYVKYILFNGWSAISHD